LGLAAAAPGTNFFAIERTNGSVAAIERKVVARGLPNVRLVAGDARCVVAHLVPADSVAAYHVYFPDPWPKRRHHRRRLAATDFATALARTLVPGGAVHVASDLPSVVEELAVHLGDAALVRDRTAIPPLRPTTSFERRYALEGTCYACWRRPT